MIDEAEITRLMLSYCAAIAAQGLAASLCRVLCED